MALIVLFTILVGLFFAWRRFYRYLMKVYYYRSILKQNGEVLKLIHNTIDMKPDEFEKELALTNIFKDQQIRNLKYSFIKEKKRLGKPIAQVKQNKGIFSFIKKKLTLSKGGNQDGKQSTGSIEQDQGREEGKDRNPNTN
tara:strand:+ start:2606 stop:3025 length:420 start_codon:yes stop_codon:yes gene_type:complete